MAAYDILTAAEVKAYLGISGSDKDTIIGTFISDASLWIEGYTGRKIAGSQSVSSEVGNGNGSEIFIPKFAPVTAVSTLKYRNSPTGSWTDLVSNSSNILIDPIDGDYVEVYGTTFPAGRSNIQITYTAGYSTVPNEIKQICYEMVVWRLRESNDPAIGRNNLGIESESSSGGSGSARSRTFMDMEPRWKRALKPFRLRRVSARGSTISEMVR